MQYQYADDHGQVFQGDRKAAIRKNWERLSEVNSGDWFVAYLKTNRFFAIGKVMTPRRQQSSHDATNTIENYLKRQKSHEHKTGFVYYTPVLYEDFSDDWVRSDGPLMRCPQRIDVEQWLYHVPDGVVVKGLKDIKPHEIQLAVFEIPKDFFDTISNALLQMHIGITIPQEVLNPKQYAEGAVTTITVNAYERNQEARQACLQHYGYRCEVCGLSMADQYGAFGENVIHVHHLRQLASVGEEYEVDPINDLRPVCPNCHAIIHTQSPPMPIEKLRIFISERKPIQWPAKLEEKSNKT